MCHTGSLLANYTNFFFYPQNLFCKLYCFKRILYLIVFIFLCMSQSSEILMARYFEYSDQVIYITTPT